VARGGRRQREGGAGGQWQIDEQAHAPDSAAAPTLQMHRLAALARALERPWRRYSEPTMPYVLHDNDGRICSLHREPPVPGCDWLDDHHPEVRAFIDNGLDVGGESAYERLDAGFVRVLEDLIDVLVKRGVINLTDLPNDAQRKLFARKGHRASSPLADLNLLGLRSGIDGGQAQDFERPL